jgi:hypothetical protein
VPSDASAASSGPHERGAVGNGAEGITPVGWDLWSGSALDQAAHAARAAIGSEGRMGRPRLRQPFGDAGTCGMAAGAFVLDHELQSRATRFSILPGTRPPAAARALAQPRVQGWDEVRPVVPVRARPRPGIGAKSLTVRVPACMEHTSQGVVSLRALARQSSGSAELSAGGPPADRVHPDRARAFQTEVAP